MLQEILKPQNSVKLLAGLSGLFFERVQGTSQDINGDAPVKEAGVAKDDLTLINGVGPTFARRLQDAGITTYAKLAELTPETVKELAQLSDWQADPVGWISQARARSA